MGHVSLVYIINMDEHICGVWFCQPKPGGCYSSVERQSGLTTNDLDRQLKSFAVFLYKTAGQSMAAFY